MDLGLTGKRALVLGASRGLGAASALALAREGVQVIAASRNPKPLDLEAGVDISTLVLDLSDPASIGAMIDAVLAQGGVDILVNNTGGPAPGPVEGQPADAWSKSFAMLAASLFRITEAMLPTMLARNWGRVITIGSSGVEQPIAGLALSNAVRGSIAGWSKTLATEVAARGVTVNMVLPGRIATDRVAELDGARAARTGLPIEQVQQASRQEIPTGRYGRPEEFGAAVAFLAGVPASYITGSMIRVDGGAIRSI